MSLTRFSLNKASIASGTTAAVINVAIFHKRSLWGYRGDSTVPFIKITCSDQKAIPRVKGAFERAQVDYNDMFRDEVMTYESNIAYTLRFMIDTKVSRQGRLVCERLG